MGIAEDKWPRTWPVFTIVLLVVTLLYVVVEIAFNARLLSALGAPNGAGEGGVRLTPKEVTSLEVTGRLLSAIAVMLMIGSSYAVQFRRKVMPQPIGFIRRRLRRGGEGPHGWGVLSVLFAVVMTLTAGGLVFNIEKWYVDHEAKSANAEERQRIYHAVRLSEGSLAWLNERDSQLRDGVDAAEILPPIYLKLADPCIAVDAAANGGAELRRDALIGPDGQAFVAIFPFAAQAYWRQRQAGANELDCQYKRMMEGLSDNFSIQRSYQTIYAPFIRCGEMQYDQSPPYETEAPKDARADEVCRAAMLKTADLLAEPSVKSIAGDCLKGPDGNLVPNVDFKMAHCMYLRSLQSAETAGVDAAADYQTRYEEERAVRITEALAKVDAGIEAAKAWPQNFYLMSQAQRDQMVAESRVQASADRRLVDLQIGPGVVPDLDDEITNCRQFAARVAKNVAVAAERRVASLVQRTGGVCFLKDSYYHTSASNEYCSKLYANFGVDCPRSCRDSRKREVPSSQIDKLENQCAASIAGAVAGRGARARREIESFPTDPGAGMIREQKYALLGEDTEAQASAAPVCRDPNMLPKPVLDRLRARVMAKIREVGAGASFRIADPEFRLPACASWSGWVRDMAASARADAPMDYTGLAAMQAIDYPKLVVDTVQGAGAAIVDWSGSNIMERRRTIRAEIARRLQELGVATTSEDAQAQAAIWVADDWLPESSLQFGQRIEREGKKLAQRILSERLGEAMRIAPGEAFALLEGAPYASFSAFLARQPVQKAAQRELQCAIDLSFAYSGFPPEVGRSARLSSPIQVSHIAAWGAEVHRPAIAETEDHLLATRFTAAKEDFEVTASGEKGRCYCAGEGAYHRAFIPGFALFVSLLGILYHSRKAMLYGLRLLPMPTSVRHAIALVAIGAAVAAPAFTTPTILRDHAFARELVGAIDNGWARFQTQWMISAQERFFVVSSAVHRLVGSPKFDQLGREPHLTDDMIVARIKATDPRVLACAKSRAVMADAPIVTRSRDILFSGGMCLPSGENGGRGPCAD